MKKLLLLLLCLILTMSMFLTSCKKDDEDDKDDEGSSENGGNQGNQGGNEGGNEGNEPETPACDHVGTLVCEKCIALLYSADLPELTLPEKTALVMKLTDFKIVMANSYSPEADGTLTADVAEAYVGLNEEGALEGYGKATLKLTYKNYTRTDNLAAEVFFEDGKVYLAADGVPFDNEDLPLNAVYFVDIAEVEELKDAQEQLAQYMPMVEQYAPVVMDWLTETLLPNFENVDLSALDAAALKVRQNAAKFINALFTATKNSDGTTTLTLGFDTLKTWNQALKDNKLNVVFDAIVGEGAFAKLEALAQDDKLYNLSVADLIDYLKTEQGVDPAKLLDAVDALMVELMGEGATLETVLGMPEGTDFGSYLEDETILAMSVKDALVMLFPADPDAETPPTAEEVVAEVKAMAAQAFEMIKSMTAYDLIMGSMGGNQEEVAPMSQETPADPMQAMVDQINGMLDMASGFFSFTMTASAAGKITDVDLAVNAGTTNVTLAIDLSTAAFKLDVAVKMENTEVGKMTVTVNSEKIVMDYKIDVEGDSAEMTYEIIPGATLTPNAEKLAAIKAELSKAEGKITFDRLVDYLKERYNDEEDENVRIIPDTENGLVYVIKYVGNHYGALTESAIATYNARFEVIAYDGNGYFALQVLNGGCGGKYELSPVYNVTRYYNVLVPVSADTPATNKALGGLVLGRFETYLDQEVYNKLSVSDDTETPEYLFNPDGTLAAYDDYELGHEWTLDETASTNGDSCTDVYFALYRCTCGKSYKEYYTNGHSNAEIYSKTADGYTCTIKCGNCNFVSDETFAFSVNSDLAFENYAYVITPYDYPMYGVALKVTVDETTAGEYEFYIETDDYVNFRSDIFKLDGEKLENKTNLYLNNDNTETYTLAAGNTYIVFLNNSYVDAESFDINIFKR